MESLTGKLLQVLHDTNCYFTAVTASSYQYKKTEALFKTSFCKERYHILKEITLFGKLFCTL